jgi:CBS domain-containing protein
MNPTPQTISANASYGQAEEMMFEAKIQALVVLSDDRIVEGIIQIF